MCGRYTQVRPEPELAALFDAKDLADLPPGRYNVAPTDPTAVVVERDQRRVVTAYRWGLVPHWAKDPRVGGRMINARAETIERSPAFRDSFARKRCPVPVDGFYEWRRTLDGKRQPYYIPAPTAHLSPWLGSGRAGDQQLARDRPCAPARSSRRRRTS